MAPTKAKKKVSKKKKPKKTAPAKSALSAVPGLSKWKRFVALSDFQAPFQLDQCVALCCAYLKRFKTDVLILNGDIVDFYMLSRFLKIGRGPKSLGEEIRITNEKVLEPILKAAGNAKIFWIEGNHEFRLKSFIANMTNGVLDDLPGTSIQDVFHMKERGIKYVDGFTTKGPFKGSKHGNGVFHLTEHLLLTHGAYTSVHAAKKTVETVGKSVIYGHVHKEQTWRQKTTFGPDLVGMGAGCLCDEPEFIKFPNYTRGFVTGMFNPTTGEWSADHKRISGPEYTDLYGDFGRMSAVYTRLRNGKSKWVVRED